MSKRFASNVLHFVEVADVSGDVDCLTTRGIDFISHTPKCCVVSGVQHDARATLRRQACRHQANAR